MSRYIVDRVRPLLLMLFAFALLLGTSVAHAAGRVEWKEKDPKEREGGSWRLEVAIYLPRAPDVAHVPMKFEFQPWAYYERSMVDGDKIVERTVPLENRQALIESVDVGFLDSGSGKIESRTRFTFKVTRAHGYEAGEYKVTIRDARNGQAVGTTTLMKFQGENEVIDRRAMVFSGEKKKPKKKDDADSGEKKDDSASAEKKEDSAPAEKSEPSDDKSSEAADKSEGNEPPAIKEKPGGCGCRVQTESGGGGAAAALALGFALAVALRRRTRSH